MLADDPLNEFQFDSEMGPVADMSTFPPTMAAYAAADDSMNGMMSMDSIFSTNFWDSVLVPGTLCGDQPLLKVAQTVSSRLF